MMFSGEKNRFEKIFLQFVFLVAMTNGQNCSTRNPCGSNGYCVDDVNGDSTCQCKFWWNGTLCNEQTSSGIQVITLGAIVGLLIVSFYGLSIFCSIRKKKQNPREIQRPVANEIEQRPTLKDLALVQVKESTRFSSILTIIFVLLTTGGTTFVRWRLIQPIHDDLVQKYLADQPLFYDQPSICDLIDAEDFNLLTFPVAAFLTLFFILFSKRSSCFREKFSGRLGPVVPLDFYVHVKRTFSAFVFAIIADELIFIIGQVISGNTSSESGVIFSYLLRISTVIVIGLRYYPSLSAVYMDAVVPLALATLYAWLDFGLSVVSASWCNNDFYPSEQTFLLTNASDLIEYFRYYGTEQNLVYIQLFNDLPRWFCWSYVIVKLPILFSRKFWKIFQNRKKNFRLTREEKILLHSSSSNSVEFSYVRNLFEFHSNRRRTRSVIGRLIPKFIYEWRDDFRFSSRIVCLYSSITLLLFFLTTQFCITLVPSLEDLRKSIQQLIDAIVSSVDSSNVGSQFPLPNFTRAFVLAFIIALIVSIIQMLVLLANIRRNLFQIYRGDHSEIPKRSSSRFLNYGTGNFQFAGFFIGYLVWGYFLVVLFAFLICISIDAFLTYGSVRLIETLLKKIIPIILLILFKQFLNKFLARYVFLQDYGDVLALNNRRILMIFLYFNFFLDSFLGVVSSIVRIVKSVIGGCLYMSRLDYSTLGRKLEHLDAGFSSYCGFIHLEATHRNPIMLAFASFLYGQMKLKQFQDEKHRQKISSSKGKRKWFLFVLLIRNPSLIFLRQRALEQLKKDQQEIIAKRRERLANLNEFVHRASLISESDFHQINQRNV